MTHYIRSAILVFYVAMFAVTTVAWMRSHWTGDVLTRTVPMREPALASPKRWDLRSDTGQIALEFTQEVFEPNLDTASAQWLRDIGSRTTTGTDFVSYDANPANWNAGGGSVLNRLGFGYYQSASNYGHGTVHKAFVIWLPWWAFTVTASCVVMIAIWRWQIVRRAMQRKVLNCCVVCGYNRRSSPNRCPECGRSAEGQPAAA